MSRKILLLNLVLVLLLGWLGMRLRSNWQEAEQQQAQVLSQDPKPAAVLRPAPIPAAQPASAGEYLNVVQQTLFSADRNPDEVIAVEPEPPPPPEPPVPPFPAYHGQMTFGEPAIIFSMNGSAQKSYHVGDKVGDFKLAAFDRETATLEWNEKTLQPKLTELRPKDAAKQAAAPPAANATPAAPAASVGSIGGNKAAAKSDPALGPQRGAYRGCLRTDTSPAGTTKDGYRKVISQGLMGSSCHWEPIN